MAVQKVFVDTSGFYSLLIRTDSHHPQAVAALEKMQNSGIRGLTTDYIIDETCTLLKARGFAHLSRSLFTLLDTSQALEFHFVAEENFCKARDFFARHLDHGYSFTDCASFVLMRELRIQQALTKDSHFSQAGFGVLLGAA